MSFRIFQFSSPDTALFSFFLAAPEKFHHRVAASSCGTAAIPKLFTRHALPSPHRAPGSFSEPTQTLSAARRVPHSFAHLRMSGQFSLFSWPPRKNPPTEFRPLHADRPRFPTSLPGTLYHRRPG